VNMIATYSGDIFNAICENGISEENEPLSPGIFVTIKYYIGGFGIVIGVRGPERNIVTVLWSTKPRR
jgi:hypothetical protein